MKKKILFFIILVAFFVGLYFVFQNYQKPKTLKVYFLDVGQGDAIFIKTPSGKTMLVDAGAKDSVLKPLSRQYLFRKKHIDILLATHPDADHVGGFVPILNLYNADVFIGNGFSKDSQTMAQIEKLISEKSIKHVLVGEGSNIELGDNISFKILGPNEKELGGESNDSSIVGQLIYGNTKILLTGDASISNEIRLVKNYGEGEELKADVLKLGHHGSRTSSAIEFLQTVRPNLVIISAGKNNRYGHPHPEVLNRLKYLNIPYLATANEGTVCIESNGDLINVCK